MRNSEPNLTSRRGKVVHIFAPRVRKALPAVESPFGTPALWISESSESDRVIMTEADIRADLPGDRSGKALQKCLYAIENVSKAFKDQDRVEEMACAMVGVVRDYDSYAGMPVLRKALELFSHVKGVREAVSEAVGRIGRPEDVVMIMDSLKSDIESPEMHLRSLANLVERYPEKGEEAIAALKALPQAKEERFQQAMNDMKVLA